MATPLEHLSALWAQNAHNINEDTTLVRAMTAQQAGLDPTQFASKFPGSTNSTTTNISGADWKVIASIAAGLIGGTIGIGSLLKPAPSTVITPAPAVQPAPLPTPAPVFDPNKYSFKIVPD